MTAHSTQGARWMAIWLPLLPTDRLRRQSAATLADRPLAFYAKSGNAFSLSAVDGRAMRLGLRAGMALADARAICPALDVREANPDADTALLNRIAAWCECYTPVVVPDPPHGLFLDITGCAHLHGGEAALLDDVQKRLKAQNFHSRTAIAPTPGAAWAFARHRGLEIVEAEMLQTALADLSISALRLETDAAALLARLGLKRIGQIFSAPRAALTARAGQNAMLRLDQALGRAPEALTPRRPPPPLYALRRLVEPVITLDALLQITGDLCDDLCADLDKKGLGATRLWFSAFGLDGGVRHVELKLSRPERKPEALIRLFKEKLEREAERFSAEFGFEAARLDALDIALWTLRPADLAPVEALHDAEAEARLIDCLTARLGSSRIGKLGVRNAHAPERVNVWRPETQSDEIRPPEDGVMRRPLMLFPKAQPIEAMASVPDGPPLRFRWRRVLRTIVRAEGPERIAPNWLRASDARTRDYFRVEDDEGQRYWLYREGFYGGSQAPRWFLHGLFA
jgi:protein ImuB